MTLTHHVREKMQERLITPKDINKTLQKVKRNTKTIELYTHMTYLL